MTAAGTVGRVDRIFRPADSIWEHSRSIETILNVSGTSLAAFLFSIFLSRL